MFNAVCVDCLKKGQVLCREGSQIISFRCPDCLEKLNKK